MINLNATHEDKQAEIEVDCTKYLLSRGFEVVDNRSKGGALWVVSSYWDFFPVAKDLKKFGLFFIYVRKGGRATKHSPGWYIK